MHKYVIYTILTYSSTLKYVKENSRFTTNGAGAESPQTLVVEVSNTYINSSSE